MAHTSERLPRRGKEESRGDGARLALGQAGNRLRKSRKVTEVLTFGRQNLQLQARVSPLRH